MKSHIMLTVYCLITVNIALAGARDQTIKPIGTLSQKPGINIVNSETVLLEESFEGDFVGWGQIDNNSDGNIWELFEDPNAAHTGNRGIGIYSSDLINDDYFCVPATSLPANHNINLSFWSRSMSNSYPESFKVKLSTTGGNSGDFTVQLAAVTNTPSTWTQYSYDISEYAGQTVYLAIQNISNNKYYQFIDDFSVISSDPATVPTAEFSANITSGTIPLSVQFSDLSTGEPTSWNWNFGDGITSSTQNPSHTYTTEGNYTVSLTATNLTGSDTETKTGYINAIDNQSPLEMPYVEAGLRYLSSVNSSTISTLGNDNNITVQGKYCYVTYRRGSGTSVADREIKLAVSDDLGQSWSEHDITTTNLNTGTPIVASTPTSVVIMYSFVDQSNEDKICVMRSSDRGLTFTTTILTNSEFLNTLYNPNYYCFTGTNKGHYFINRMASFDDGLTFTTINQPSNVIAITETIDQLWMLCYDSQTGTNYLYKSQDNGLNYQLVDEYQNEIYYGNPDYVIICQKGNDLFIVWISEEVSKYYLRGKKITDNTASSVVEIGTLISNYIGDINVFWINNNIWISTNSRYIIRSNDEGITWSRRIDVWSECDFYYPYPVNGDEVIVLNDTTLLFLHNTSIWNQSDRIFKFGNVKWTDTSILTCSYTITQGWRRFFWDSYLEPQASSHHLQISDSRNFTNILVDETKQGSSLTYIDLDLRSTLYGGETEYFARICGEDGNPVSYTTEWSPTIAFNYGTTDIQVTNSFPNNYVLHNNYPNPFNPSTTIEYELPTMSNVMLSIININGQIINQLVNESQDVGKYSVNWNASNCPSGIYLYMIQAGDFKQVRKCLLVK